MSEEGPDRFGTNFMILPDDGGGRFASRGSSPTEGYEAQMFSSRSSGRPSLLFQKDED